MVGAVRLHKQNKAAALMSAGGCDQLAVLQEIIPPTYTLQHQVTSGAPAEQRVASPAAVISKYQ
jgi:hypothetical protein